jgi:TatA/E family protein of Tat protein translocase
MFGIGPQEMVLIGLLFLVIFGPGKLPSMARDFGRFMSEAHRYIDEFKSELVSGAEDETPEHGETEEEPSLNGAAHDEMPGAEEEAEATRTEQKA